MYIMKKAVKPYKQSLLKNIYIFSNRLFRHIHMFKKHAMH